jgi:hypothetical protein
MVNTAGINTINFIFSANFVWFLALGMIITIVIVNRYHNIKKEKLDSLLATFEYPNWLNGVFNIDESDNSQFNKNELFYDCFLPLWQPTYEYSWYQ